MRRIYSYYCALAFVILFLLFFIPLLIPILFPKKHRLVGVINRWWGWCIFSSWFMPASIEYRTPLDTRKQYIFCPNHFSYLDIPGVALNQCNAIFVGKSAMEKIPLFGFMYSRLHITVDRSNLRSKFNTLKRSLEAIDEGKSLVIYPEGGIVTHDPPHMASFKDGPFRVAIEKQIPIVPVTIPHNWIILPSTKLVMHWGHMRIIFHPPVSTEGLTLADVDDLKIRVRDIIAGELEKQNAS